MNPGLYEGEAGRGSLGIRRISLLVHVSLIPSSVPGLRNLLALRRRCDQPKSNDNCLKCYSIEDFCVTSGDNSAPPTAASS